MERRGLVNGTCNLTEREIPIWSFWYFDQFCNCHFVQQKTKSFCL